MLHMKKIIFIAAMFCSTILPLLSAELPDTKKIALILGSGGNKGLAHVGVIEELEKLGVVPDLIVGCSAGAIVGALYAQHRDIAKVKEILIDLKHDDLVDLSLFQKQALSTRKKLEEFLNQHLDAKDFASLKIPLVIVTTDLHKGKPVYFHAGELHPIVLASAALPGLFPPYKMGDKVYVDGGISDPLPVRFAQSLGNFFTIASDITPSLDGFDTDNLFQVIRKSLEVAYQRLAYSARTEADILFEMNFSKDLASPIEDSHNQEIYEIGKEIVQQNSEKILQTLPLSLISPLPLGSSLSKSY